MHVRLPTAQLKLARRAAQGLELPVDSIMVRELHSRPPKLLTEAELLAQMERHQSGTDASMSTHVSNVAARGYVEVVGVNSDEAGPSAARSQM